MGKYVCENDAIFFKIYLLVKSCRYSVVSDLWRVDTLVFMQALPLATKICRPMGSGGSGLGL